jgi:hypothetical protein
MSIESLRAEITRYDAEIAHLQAALEETGAGRYRRALEARTMDRQRCLRLIAEVHLAKPLLRQPLAATYFRSIKITEEERAWLEGRADCPRFKGREAELAAIRAEHWPNGVREGDGARH